MQRSDWERTPTDVVVITGVGDMGHAAARRLGTGHLLVLADFSEDNLMRRTEALRADGYFVHPVQIDISDRDAVEQLATTAAGLGAIRALFNTAGLSPVDAPAQRIFTVNVLGTAYLLDAFEPHVGPGSAAVFIASMAGSMADLPADVLHAMATVPAHQLLDLPVFDSSLEATAAYGISKRANQVRVQAASVAWGRRGARVNSISPGIIATRDGRDELAGPSGPVMQQLLAASAVKRLGTPDDIAAVVEFLVGPQAAFVTGTDLLVDGGCVAGIRYAPG
jgi:NAD(P)-dependent dehydrogenase (short-subunit alcohol dehydrogenase family)